MIERKKVVIVAACAALVLLIVGTVSWWLGRGGGGGSEQGSVQSYKEELKAKFNGAVVSDTEKYQMLDQLSQKTAPDALTDSDKLKLLESLK